MTEKVSTENGDNGFSSSHDEKNWALDPASPDEKGETSGRRHSVALNIVENPLQVSLATSHRHIEH